MENRKYIIFNKSEISLIDFSQIIESDPELLRYSVDGSKTFIKWETENDPDFIINLNTKEGPYNNYEISLILSSNEWNSYYS
jgi:hypothetical protein